MKQLLRMLLLGAVAFFAIDCKRHHPEAIPPVDEHQRIPGEVSLLAMGDWGQVSGDRQTVANAMAEYATAQHPIDAAVLLGDNFYMSLKGTEDSLIQTLFEKTYDRSKLNFPFYIALGNHDYSTKDAKIELDYPRKHPESRWRMPAKYYRVDLPAGQPPLVTVLMLDSNKDFLTSGEWMAEIAWIKQELAKPRGRWTVCCAHHTLFSNGAHGDNGVLQKEWGSLFQLEKVDFYLCGHDHDLQHLEIDGWHTSFVVSGGGTSHREMRRDNRGPYSCSATGFASLHFTDTTALVRIIDAHGALLHEFSRDTEGAVDILHTTPSSSATKHQLKVMEGFEGVRIRPGTRPATRPSTTGASTAPASTDSSPPATHPSATTSAATAPAAATQPTVEPASPPS